MRSLEKTFHPCSSDNRKPIRLFRPRPKGGGCSAALTPQAPAATSETGDGSRSTSEDRWVAISKAERTPQSAVR